MKKKIVVVGSINLDLVAFVPRMPVSGETITGQSFATYPGGKGANQAVGAARLGGNVVMIGRVGEDLFATQLLDELSSAGVSRHCVESVPGPSGSAVVMVTPAGDNSIVVIPGANDSLQPADLDLYLDELRSASLILSQLEIPLPTVERLAELAREFGVPFMLDPAPARELPPTLLRNVTWLTPNESETQILLQGLRGNPNFEPAVAAQHLLDTGVRNVILKMGSRGVFLAGEAMETTYLPAFPVEVVDTTAAGDAFNGGFAYGLSDGMEPIEAARFANAVAAVSVSKTGAQPSMPKLADVNRMLVG
ncbi:ribokinase [Terriglobus saanensis]|uniref:Ribokinase n=1 Tax=Terriglobus saanensis (strain ATCC BAA-1853 / DSM 23119 / SP1PR4) TaxID=401053 RepID=E8UX94_TERSS|nr:ribokinase [Terriglobus saanensis]ADV83057.1 ribokinase [Terriglobus saanensis SP1PR4]